MNPTGKALRTGKQDCGLAIEIRLVERLAFG
jgi:hypothetical protein